MQKLLNYNYLYLIPLFLSAIAGLRSFRLAWLKPYRSLAILLQVTVVIEWFAIGWKWSFYKTAYWSYSKSNLWIYNAFLLIRLAFYLHLYYLELTSPRIKKFIRFGAAPLLIFGLVNYIIIQYPNEINNYSIILYHIVILALSLAFFNQEMKEKVIIKLGTNPMVWISLGTMIYYSGSLPFFVLLGFLNKDNANFVYSLLYINTALNTLMYTFYLISFLCKPRILK